MKSLSLWLLALAALPLLLLESGKSESSGCVVEGVVMDWDYAVLPAFTIELVGARTYTTRSDDIGHFNFSDIPDGEYLLKPGSHYQSHYWVPVYKMRKMKLTGGHQRQHIDLVLKPRR
jgi:hypothetical protein